MQGPDPFPTEHFENMRQAFTALASRYRREYFWITSLWARPYPARILRPLKDLSSAGDAVCACQEAVLTAIEVAEAAAQAAWQASQAARGREPC